MLPKSSKIGVMLQNFLYAATWMQAFSILKVNEIKLRVMLLETTLFAFTARKKINLERTV